MYAKSSILHVNWFVAQRSASLFRWHCIRHAVVFYPFNERYILFVRFNHILSRSKHFKFARLSRTEISCSSIRTHVLVHVVCFNISSLWCRVFAFYFLFSPQFFLALLFRFSSRSCVVREKKPERTFYGEPCSKLFCDRVPNRRKKWMWREMWRNTQRKKRNVAKSSSVKRVSAF